MQRPAIAPAPAFAIAVGIAVAVLTGSCGSDDSSESAEPTSTAPSTTTVPSDPTVPETTVPDTTVPETTVPETTVPVTDDRPDCVGDDWVRVDEEPFSFWIPSDLLDQNPQGIDSLVGRFVGSELEVSFDFGWYSPSIDEVARLGATIVPVDLGGIAGEYGTADATAAEYGSDWITHLYAALPDDSGTALWMGVNYDDPALTPTAECIVSTPRFP